MARWDGESVFKEGNRYEFRKGKSWAHTSLASTRPAQSEF